MQNPNPCFSSMLSVTEHLLTSEEMLATMAKKKGFTIGIPCEIDPCEKRVPLTPEGVESLVSQGYTVLIEKGAGVNANFSDLEYSEKGAVIIDAKESVYKADLVIKINFPSYEEAQMISERQTLLSNLSTGLVTVKSLQHLICNKVTAIASEEIIGKMGEFAYKDAVLPIEGKAAILMAAELMSNKRGNGVLLGGVVGVEPSEILILGAGTSALFAAQAALGLGASVKIFSSSLKGLADIQHKTNQISLYTNVLNTQTLERALPTADVVIGTYDLWEENSPFLVTEEMIQKMKKGAIIIDLSVRMESCFETLRYHSEYLSDKYGIRHYCVPSISSRVAHTTSIALNNVFAPIIFDIAQAPSITYLLKRDKGLRNGVYLYNGILTNARLANKYNLSCQDIDFLLTAF